MLPADALTEYKRIYKERYGTDLSDDEAAFRANQLVNLYKAVYGEPDSYEIGNGSKDNG